MHAGALGYMLGRSAEGPQAGPQGRQASSPLSPHQTAEMSQKASDAFDAAAAGGLNNMAELKAVTSDMMSSQSRQEGTSRSPSPHLASVEHLSPAANLAMLQACVRCATSSVFFFCAGLPGPSEALSQVTCCTRTSFAEHKASVQALPGNEALSAVGICSCEVKWQSTSHNCLQWGACYHCLCHHAVDQIKSEVHGSLRGYRHMVHA